jgi:hypothetical protein
MNLTSKLLFEQGICKIYLVEEFPTENKMLLHQRERFYIENFECVNYNVPGRTKREWEVNNKKHISKQKKLYQYKNADKIAKQQKEWYFENREEILEKIKQYQVKNTDKIKEQRRIYRLQNRDKIKADNKAYREKKKLEKSSQPN